MSRRPEHERDAESVLAAHGIPFTRQRRVILTFFQESPRAATIVEAAEALREYGISQATVYRAAALFADLGLLVGVRTRGGEMCYTGVPVGHSHPLICSVCRRVIHFDGAGDLDALHAQLEEATGFRIYGHHLEVYGICPQCRGREAHGMEPPRN